MASTKKQQHKASLISINSLSSKAKPLYQKVLNASRVNGALNSSGDANVKESKDWRKVKSPATVSVSNGRRCSMFCCQLYLLGLFIFLALDSQESSRKHFSQFDPASGNSSD
jgi:hypothetical protein